MRGPASLVAAATLALVAAPAVAQGEPPDAVPARARGLAERGRAMYDAGDYAGALAAFQQAYSIAPSPGLLFNLAQAYRLRGSCNDAALMYARYLATNPAADRRALATDHLQTVERCARDPELARPLREAARRAPTPPRPPELDDAPAALPGRARRGALERSAGTGLMIGGGAALAVAAYYAAHAHDDERTVTDGYARGASWQELAPVDRRGRAAASSARIFGVGGALGLAGGLALYLVGTRTDRAPLTLAVTHHSVEVNTRWTF